MKSVSLKVALVCLALWGMVSADVISMTSLGTTHQWNRTWQDVAGVSYSWIDNTGGAAGVLEVGEKVTFSVDMHKKQWGTHDYDVLKVWIGDEEINAPVGSPGTELKNTAYPFIWDFNADNPDNFGDASTIDVHKIFSFDYTFDAAGTYDLTASVMCSRDLSGFYFLSDANRWNDKPTIKDWDEWAKDAHSTKRGTNGYRLQGETERFQLAVATHNVPEPSSLALILLGLTSLSGALFFRRKK